MKEADIRPGDLFNRYLELLERDAKRMLDGRSLFSRKPCPACGMHRGSPAFEKSGFSWARCGECSSLYVSPRPSPEQIDSFYRHGEAPRFWATDFFRTTAEARRERIFAPRAHLAAELAERMGCRDGSVADVGAGYGIFLEVLRALETFERIVGIEPSPELAAVCRDKGFDVVESPVEDVPDHSISVNLATAFEVLEHVHDPRRFLEACARLLAPGGLLLFTTLTASGFDIEILGARAKAVSPPQHLNLLTVNGIERLVERSGLELVELSTPGVLDVDIVRNTLQEHPEIRVPPFVRALAEHPDEAVRSSFQEYLTAHGLSSHVRVIARKPETLPS